MIKMPKKGEYVEFKKCLNEFYINKYKKDVASSCGYKLVCVDDKFSKHFRSYWDEDTVYNFISSMIEESKCCTDVMKKHFSKELVMTKKHMKILRTQLNFGFVIMMILKKMLK